MGEHKQYYFAVKRHTLTAVDVVINSPYEGYTLRGADHYDGDDKSKYAFWADEYEPITKIGKHISCRS